MTEADKRILQELQENGRITNQELAARCGLSPSACFDRTRRLRESGYILGFTALLNPEMIKRPLLIFIEVLLDRTTGNVFRQFADAVRPKQEILECHMVAGGFDYLIKVRMESMASYRLFMSEVLADMPGVRETRTYAVIEEVKTTTILPL